jgi:hypothetical protein
MDGVLIIFIAVIVVALACSLIASTVGRET